MGSLHTSFARTAPSVSLKARSPSRPRSAAGTALVIATHLLSSSPEPISQSMPFLSEPGKLCPYSGIAIKSASLAETWRRSSATATGAAAPVPDAPAAAPTAGGRGGRGGVTGVPFVATGRGGGGGGGGGGFGGFGAAAVGPLVEPGTYMVRLTVGGQTLTSSVTVLEDIWMRPQ